MLISEQLILGIEGSGYSISVGLMEKGVPLGLIYLNDGSPGSETLLPAVDQLLSMVKISRQDLDGVCVTLGPGAFTSLRISLSMAEALGLGLGIPVYGTNCLALIAATVPFYAHKIKVIQNAYKGEFYTATYNTNRGYADEIKTLGLITAQNFLNELQENDLILGNGIKTLIDKGYDLTQKMVRFNNDFQRAVSGIGVIEYFLDTEAREPSEIPLEPIYIRQPDAEVNYSRQFRKT